MGGKAIFMPPYFLVWWITYMYVVQSCIIVQGHEHNFTAHAWLKAIEEAERSREQASAVASALRNAAAARNAAELRNASAAKARRRLRQKQRTAV